MKSLKFGDIVRHKSAGREKAVVISPMDDDGHFWLLYEKNGEDELAHIDDCEIVENGFIRLCRLAEQQLTGFQQACYDNADVGALLSSMGLQADEWEYMKNNIGIEWLEDELKDGIESYFGSEK